MANGNNNGESVYNSAQSGDDLEMGNLNGQRRSRSHRNAQSNNACSNGECCLCKRSSRFSCFTPTINHWMSFISISLSMFGLFFMVYFFLNSRLNDMSKDISTMTLQQNNYTSLVENSLNKLKVDFLQTLLSKKNG